MRYKIAWADIVCLCGSTRFPEAFRAANVQETLADRIVLSIGCNQHTDPELAGLDPAYVEELKERLDRLHKQKIDLADSILVVSDETGYFGESTTSEIAYARAHGKPVRFQHPAAEERARGIGAQGRE